MASRGVRAIPFESEPGRRGEILDAALAVFAEKGYAAGSMREIASRVGVTEPALYRHFPGKEALFLALVRVTATHLRDDAFALMDGLEPEGLREQIESAIRDRRRAVAVFGNVLRIFAGAAYDATVLDEVRDLVVEPALARLDAKVAELDAAYGIPADAASREKRVRAFLSLFVGTIASSVVIGDEPDADMADAVVRLMGWERAAGERER